MIYGYLTVIYEHLYHTMYLKKCVCVCAYMYKPFCKSEIGYFPFITFPNSKMSSNLEEFFVIIRTGCKWEIEGGKKSFISSLGADYGFDFFGNILFADFFTSG